MRAVVLTAALGLGACAAFAGPIERACVQAGRTGATAARCDCIQRVADSLLDRGEQRMVARFFEDPDRAQEVRQSDRPAHGTFWQRYKYFGAAAERSCR